MESVTTMQVEQILLMGQHTMKNIQAPTGDSSLTVLISYAQDPAPEEKPWPYEITYNVQVVSADRMVSADEIDEGAEGITMVFEAELHYAAQFDHAVDLKSGDALNGAAMAAWPYVRADFVQLFHLHEIPMSFLPATPSLSLNDRGNTQA